MCEDKTLSVMPQTFGGEVPGIPGARVYDVDSLPGGIEGALPAGLHAQAKADEFLMAMPEVGRFRASGGAKIEVAPAIGADPGLVRLLLNGTLRGALIHERGELPLHAATLVPPDGGAAVAICGASGSGKSTLAAALTRRGWKLLADDMTRIAWQDGQAIAWPSRQFVKLWRDTCEAMGVDIASVEQVAATLDKFYVPVPAHSEPAVLGSIFEITAGDVPAGQVKLAGERMALLTRHTYRREQIPALGAVAAYAQLLAKVADACRLFRLAPARAETPAALAGCIARMLNA